MDLPSEEESGTLARLKKKYQGYKSAYYLQNKRDHEGKIIPYNLY